MDNLIQSEESTHRLDKLRVKILFEQTGPTQWGSLAVAGIFLFLFRHNPAFDHLKIWMGSLLLLTFARFCVLRFFSKYYVKYNRDFNSTKWENIFALLAGCAGAFWGAAVCLVLPASDLLNDALVGYILAGITAGAAVAYSSSLRSIYSFFIPAVIPFAVGLALKDGETYWGMSAMVIAYSSVFLKLTQKFNQYAVNAINLSFQKDELIQKIRLMQGQVTQSAQMVALGEMAGGMAHEVNNPLAIIKGACEGIGALVDGEDLEKAIPQISRFLEAADKSSDRIAKIIKELRSFAGRPGDENYDVVPVKRIVETATDFCRERFKNHNIIFSVNEISEDLLIECRPFHVTQVLLNTLTNAYDAICKKEDKWIRLEVSTDGENIEITVTDSGRGIPEEIRSRIMQPFFTTKDIGKGMGLGLSVSKGIVNEHHGDFRLDAGWPNTRFVISLPKTRKTVDKAS